MEANKNFEFIKDLRKINKEELFIRFNDVKVSTIGSKIGFSYVFAEILWTFKELINFNTPIPESDKEIILTRVISKLIVDKTHSYDQFCKSLDSELFLYKAKKDKIFICSTSISIAPFKLSLSNSLRCETIRFQEIFTTKIKKERKKYGIIEKDGNTKVSFTIRTYDHQIALQIAKEALDTIRCFLNLQYNPDIESDYLKFYDRILPINQIYTDNHFIISELFESSFINSKKFAENIPSSNIVDLNSFGLNPKIVLSNVKMFVKKIEKCKPNHKKSILESVQLFVKSFDETDPHLTFLGGWASLERLTDSNENEKIIKRLLAFYNKNARKKAFLTLIAIKEFRNKFVHEGIRENDAISASLILQQIFLDHLIKVHLKNPGTFNSMQEFNYLLDNLNMDRDAVNKRIETYQIIKKIKIL